MPEREEHQDQERAAAEHRPWVNQHRDEPLPASHHAGNHQIAAADNEEGQDPRVRHVANAVPGRPDGEVDTRS